MLTEVPLFLTTYWAIISVIPAVIIGTLTIVHQTLSIYKLALDIRKTKTELVQIKSDKNERERSRNPEYVDHGSMYQDKSNVLRIFPKITSISYVNRFLIVTMSVIKAIMILIIFVLLVQLLLSFSAF